MYSILRSTVTVKVWPYPVPTHLKKDGVFVLVSFLRPVRWSQLELNCCASWQLYRQIAYPLPTLASLRIDIEAGCLCQ